MKIKILYLAFLISLFSYSNTIGLGGNLGTINGIKLNVPKKDKMYNFSLSYDFSSDNTFLIAGDYLIKNKQIEFLKDLPFWYGLQLKLDIENQTNISVQSKGELLYSIPDFEQLQLFTSVSPGLKIIPKTKFDIDFSIGVQYLFDIKN